MPKVDYHYTRTSTKSVAEAITALEAALAKHKFGALWHLNMQEKLKEKGLDLATEFHVFEVCNPSKAKEALDTSMEVGYFLPCKLVVFNQDGTTRIGLLRPELMMELLGEERLQALATGVESELRQVVDEAARSGE